MYKRQILEDVDEVSNSRFIQSEIETKLAKEIIKGTVHQGQHVEVDYQDGFVLKAQ